jgi:hypothetical protein
MKNLKYALSFSALMLAVAIGSQSCYYDKYEDLHPNGCDTTSISYTSNIKPIIDDQCGSCHNPSYNQQPYLTSYDECKTAVESGSVINRIDKEASDPSIMPPSGKMNQCSISFVKVWKSQGFKQ